MRWFPEGSHIRVYGRTYWDMTRSLTDPESARWIFPLWVAIWSAHVNYSKITANVIVPLICDRKMLLKGVVDCWSRALDMFRIPGKCFIFSLCGLFWSQEGSGKLPQPAPQRRKSPKNKKSAETFLNTKSADFFNAIRSTKLCVWFWAPENW